ncbi:transglycosylase domain-containing protein, partial [Enterococcus faecalis]|uniref:transglycosylase domain-containing protein n=1 Tax=Enterococcus faecalis TaxID=1351 RepID=UPI0019D6DD15
RRDIERCAFANSDAGLQRGWRTYRAICEKRRIPVTLDQIPPEMINAFIATEDSRFYEHHGIDPVGIFRAASVALFS